MTRKAATKTTKAKAASKAKAAPKAKAKKRRATVTIKKAKAKAKPKAKRAKAKRGKLNPVTGATIGKYVVRTNAELPKLQTRKVKEDFNAKSGHKSIRAKFLYVVNRTTRPGGQSISCHVVEREIGSNSTGKPILDLVAAKCIERVGTSKPREYRVTAKTRKALKTSGATFESVAVIADATVGARLK